MALNTSLLCDFLPFNYLQLLLSFLLLFPGVISLYIDHIRLNLISLLQSDQWDSLVAKYAL